MYLCVCVCGCMDFSEGQRRYMEGIKGCIFSRISCLLLDQSQYLIANILHPCHSRPIFMCFIIQFLLQNLIKEFPTITYIHTDRQTDRNLLLCFICQLCLILTLFLVFGISLSILVFVFVYLCEMALPILD